MSKASGSIDLKSLKVAGEPNKYITKITGDGIKVHDSQNQTNNYIQITSAVIEVYKGANSVASFGETVNIGKYKEYGDKKIVIGPSGFKIMLVNSSRTDGSTSTILEETVLAEIATLNLSTDLFATYYSFGRRKEGSDIGSDSIAEGIFVTASGVTSHAEGMATSAIGNYSHAEGNTTSAIGYYSHAEGLRTIASGHGSHTQNVETIALEDYQTVIGKYNAATVSGEGTTSSPYEYSDVGDYAFIIGNGTDNTTAARSNAFMVDWSGDIYPQATKMTDFIVEEGTSGIWTYRKWNSGISECWGRYTWNITSWTTWGGWYYSNASSAVNYPTNLFIEAPSLTTNGRINGLDCALYCRSGADVATNTATFAFFRPSGGTTGTGQLSLYAIGKWK